ncbi:unnamed protein product, partial [Brenthis ino]
MEAIKKGLADRSGKKNGLYVHYSPPKLLGVSSEQLRHWALSAVDCKLERAVLAGQGRRLLAEAEALPLARRIVALIDKCNALHAAVEKGSLLELQELLNCDYNRHKYVMCLDEAGVGLLHKAVFYNFTDIVAWLVNHYPQLVHQKDSQGRTPLHYTAACRDEALVVGVLERAGAARGARDAAGRTLAHYRSARTLLALPDSTMPRPAGLVIKRHNIRIWCHECDMGRLQKVVWEGQGARLLSEVSSQPIVKKFLEAVPYIMNTIRDIHNAVIQNDLETLMKLTADPVPPQALSSRDANNLTAMHKAAGLGHGSILKYIIERYPQGINDVDNDGRTPLHYAAVVKDEQHTFNTLLSSGADESAVDNKNKTPAYYINRTQDIDKNIFKVLPEAPRTPSSAYPSSWDWKILDTDFIGDFKKSRKKHLKASSENISSKNNTTTISDSVEKNNGDMKNSSTHELISGLPDLNDNEKPNVIDNNMSNENDTINKDTTQVEDATKNNDEEDINEDVDKVQTEKETEIDEIPVTEQILPKETENIEEANNAEKVNHEHINGDLDKEDQSEPEQILADTLDNNKEKTELKQSNINAVNQDILDNKNSQEEANVTENVNEGNNEPKEIINDEDKNNQNADENEDLKNEEDNEDGDDNNKDESIVNDAPDSLEIVSQLDNEQEGKQESVDEKTNTDDDDKQDLGNKKSRRETKETDQNVDEHRTTSHEGNNGRNVHENPIEGIISSEAELETEDASIRDGYHNDILIVDNEIDPEVTDLINTANMEMLATLVLNGEGSRLIGRQSRNTELQAFLNNVPNYMEKINKVHIAAREGNIRDLQAALDRRKFAIARDPISANGATPLHVATVYGKTNIMKYLGGRFPETLSAVDFEGRTALHYAAVLPDNGHYYNILQQLGANSKDLDDNGRSTEDYYKNPTLFPFRQLLTDFGISEETATIMFADKVPDDRVSSRRTLDIPETLDTLERCYRLLASARPTRTPLSASSNKATPPHVLGRFLNKQIFELIKYRITKLDHNLFDVIWPAVKKLPDTRNILQTVEEDFPGGVTAPDYYVYEVFTEFLTPLIKDLHNINISYDLPDHPISDFIKNTPLSDPSEPLVEINIDPNDDYVLSGTMECSRNLDGFELPLNLKIGKLEYIERIITTILMREDFARIIEQLSPESDQKGGTYYTLNEVLEKPSEISATLASTGLLIPLCERNEIDDSSRLHGKHWPYGRGVFVSDDKTVAIWINVHDHLRVLTTTPIDAPGEIGLTFSKLSYIMTYLHEKLDFVWNHKLGHLSCRPTFLGAGIRFSLIVSFPGLAKDSDNMKHLCAMRGLQYRETLSADIARVSNYQCLNATESNCFNDFVTATSNLLHLEKELSMQDSAHIATMLTNIFKRKRSSLADIHDPIDRIQEKQ